MEIHVADERSQLEARLDSQREQILGILAELDEQEARQRLVPSLTTPLALVKHARIVERVWFHSRVAGIPRAELGIPDSVEDSFVLTSGDTIESVRRDFLDACAHSRAVAADHDLDEQFPWHHGPVDLRFIYGHMIAEFARHAGHGDILVEQLRDRRRQNSTTG